MPKYFGLISYEYNFTEIIIMHSATDAKKKLKPSTANTAIDLQFHSNLYYVVDKKSNSCNSLDGQI